LSGKNGTVLDADELIPRFDSQNPSLLPSLPQAPGQAEAPQARVYVRAM